MAGVAKITPFNAAAEMTMRGAVYGTSLLPLVASVTTDGRLVTGLNPGSAKATAKAVARQMWG